MLSFIAVFLVLFLSLIMANLCMKVLFKLFKSEYGTGPFMKDFIVALIISLVNAAVHKILSSIEWPYDEPYMLYLIVFMGVTYAGHRLSYRKNLLDNSDIAFLMLVQVLCALPAYIFVYMMGLLVIS